jgi:peptidoglycan hydrolase-like protein with peptidoglycan-binding domain
VAAFGRRRPVIVAAVVLVLLGLAGAAAVVWWPRTTAPTASRPAPATTKITRETLVDVTTAPGKLAYGPEQPVESRISGTVTGLPAVGAVVNRGQVLFRVDDRPVVLFFGGLPAYRDLTEGHAAPSSGTTPSTPAPGGAVPATKGADVREFEENLHALGYSGFTVDDQYNGQTAAAVRRWQKDLGLDQTGVVDLGRVFYAPGPIRVSKLKLTLGAVTTGPVLTYTADTRLVTASLKEHNQALAKVGTKVTVVLPSGKELPGSVLSVGTPADDAAAAAGQEPTLDVTVALDDPSTVNGLDDGPAQVQFVAQEREDVLVVPVGALLALAEGGYGLEVLGDGPTRVVTVTTGLFADGKVEVGGPDIRAGMTVGMAQ